MEQEYLEVENKIFIRKEKLDIRATVCGAILLMGFGMYISLQWHMPMLLGVFFSFLFFMVKYYVVRRKNELIKRGKVVWCKVDRSRCENNQAGIVIRAGDYWKDKKQFVEYSGLLPMIFGSVEDEYIEKIYTVKYVPVFVDDMDMNRYKMVLCDQWMTWNEVEKQRCMKSVIRVIDSWETKKEVEIVHESEN